MERICKRGVILMNLGSPDAPTEAAVKKYLIEFLMDERVLDMPYIFRAALVKGIIAPFRSAKSAEAYQTIWTKEGSPLIAITKQLQNALSEQIPEPVEIAMRYGSPSMEGAYQNLNAKYPNLEEVVLFPLYPHYAMSSYETAVEHAKAVYRKGDYKFAIKVVEPFYNYPDYIDALAESISGFHVKDQYLLFSFHSIPESHIVTCDITGRHCLNTPDCCDRISIAHQYCYRHQCIETMKLVAEKLGLMPDEFGIAFQSKLGRAEWLKPSTTSRLAELAKGGKKNVAVVCPAFVSDCLETLEEIAVHERKTFLDAGGGQYTFIPCLNIHPKWVNAMVKMIG